MCCVLLLDVIPFELLQFSTPELLELLELLKLLTSSPTDSPSPHLSALLLPPEADPVSFRAL